MAKKLQSPVERAAASPRSSDTGIQSLTLGEEGMGVIIDEQKYRLRLEPASSSESCWTIKRRSNGGAVHMDLYIKRRQAATASAYPKVPGLRDKERIDVQWFDCGNLMIDDVTVEHAAAFAAGLAEMIRRIKDEFTAIESGEQFPRSEATVIASG